jgi:DNA-binding transcriptional LysR family regulator
MRNAGLVVRDARRRAPHHEEDPIYRHSQMAAYFAVAKIRWHRAFVQCIVLNTSISYLDVIMDMDQIRTFVAVARGRSFSGAAATLHRSQPAISRRIELLEREFDIALFERLRGGSILTDAGAAFLPYAEIVLAAAADGAEALRAGRQGETGKIPLALVGTLANAALTNALRKFGKQYPKVRLELRTATSQEVSDLVQRGEPRWACAIRTAAIPASYRKSLQKSNWWSSPARIIRWPMVGDTSPANLPANAGWHFPRGTGGRVSSSFSSANFLRRVWKMRKSFRSTA